jgi:glutathione gamma-glutamylcysteinyltransferase
MSTISTSLATNTSSTFHKRPLPESLISLSSKNGKEIFREALASGGMESYFALAEQFVTQSEPAYCSLSSLAMVLNALNFDPKKVWKGVWRWVSEETLQCETQVCGHTLEKVRRNGMDFNEFEIIVKLAIITYLNLDHT